MSPDNPILHICKCKGSSGNVHVECLKAYLDTKKKVQANKARVETLYWKRFECEICKQSYPLSVNIGGQDVPLITYAVPESNHIVLESQHHLLESNTQRIVHIAKPHGI